MIQCSGMLTDVESARLLPVMRYCSLTVGQQEFLYGGNSEHLHSHCQDNAPGSAPCSSFRSLPARKVSILIGCSDGSLLAGQVGGGVSAV